MLLDGVAHPVDLRVAPDGLVVGVDHDALGQKKRFKRRNGSTISDS